MADSTFNLNINATVTGDAQSKLEQIDKLAEKLNGKDVTINANTGDAQKNVSNLGKDIDKQTKNAQKQVTDAQDKIMGNQRKNYKTQSNLQSSATSDAEKQAKKQSDIIDRTSREYRSALSDVKKTYSGTKRIVQDKAANRTDFSNIQEALKSYKDEAARYDQQVEDVKKAYGQSSKTYASVAQMRDNYYTRANSDITQMIEKDADSVNDKIQNKIRSITQSGRGIVDDVKQGVNQAQESLKSLGETAGGIDWMRNDGALKKHLSTIQDANEAYKQLGKDSNITMDTGTLAKQARRAESTLDLAMSKDTKKQLSDVTQTLENGASGAAKVTVGKYRQELKPQLETLITQAQKESGGSTGFFKRIGASIKSQNAALIGQFFSTQDLINYGRQMSRYSIAVDSAMTELRKVSGASEPRLNQSRDLAYRLGQKYGASGSNIIQSISNWRRLGYSLDTSEKYAEYSQLLSNVGDDQTVQSASESLTSIQKAWNMNEKQTRGSVDKLNEVANNYSVTTSDLSEALMRGGSSLSAAGTSFEKSLGLIVAANDTIRNPQKAGNALKTNNIVLVYANMHKRTHLIAGKA